MRSITLPCTALAVLAAVATPVVARPAAAQLAPGSTLTFSGVANATDVGSPGVFLDFLGRVTVDRAGVTGGFAPLARPGQPATGAIANLTVGSGPQQIGQVLQLGAFRFDLTHLPTGTYGQDECYVAPLVGQKCTPYQFPAYTLSPFYLENLATPGTDGVFTALISFDVAGTVTAYGQTQNFRGTISSIFVGASFQEALGGLEAYGLPAVPFTGRFVVEHDVRALGASAQLAPAMMVTPEPGTVMLVATGLLGVAGVAARRRRTSRD